MKPRVTPELIWTALGYIPANLPHDEWAKLCAAIKSELPDETGLALFAKWSATADSYDPAAVASTWKSFKAAGGVTIGTLLGMAKDRGFVLPKANQAAAKPDPATVARLNADRKAKDDAERVSQDAAQALAATAAVKLWDSAGDTGDSPYLERKGVQPYGVRYLPGGWLLVPMRDVAGVLWNVQRIAPQKNESGNDKWYGATKVVGSRKNELLHWCGDPVGAAAILIAEGYATAASLHQATGRAVAVAFDAGNLMHVAKALRNQYPAALIVLCGDDDRETQAKTNRNPGREKAMAAARAVRGVAVFPGNMPDGGKDFNDMHHAQGLEVVRQTVDGAIDSHELHQDAPRAAHTSMAGKRSQSASRERTEPQNTGGVERFQVLDGDGVYYTPPGDDGGSPRKVCGVLRVVGLARDAHDNQVALLLEFVTQFGKVRSWLMPLSMLAGDGNAYRTALLNQGFMTPTDGRRRAWLTEYLQSRNPESLERVRHVPRVGWAGRCYVLPNETLGTNPNGERVIFHSEVGIEANFSQRGTSEQWRNELGRLCVGNSRAMFAVATSLAGPLLAWASGTTGGGIHYTGPTSIGKTTCFLLAASVWGKGTEKDPESYMQKWRATSNGLEYQGEQHNDCTLILDELGQMDAGDAGNAAYMLADGMGKTRGKGAGGLRPKPTWRLLFLSSGELTLAQHMETVGKKMKGGQEVRLIPLPTEVKEGSALETFHEFPTGHELSGWVQSRAARCYGVVGREWLEYLVAHTDGLAADLRLRMDSIEAELMPSGASGQVKRGVRRFALIAAAGEMATAAGLTGWSEFDAIWAAQQCLDAWINLRGGSGSSEKTNMLRQVRSFLEANGEGRFTYWHRASDDRVAKTLNKAGVRRMLNAEGEPIKNNGQHKAQFGEEMHPVDGEDVSFEYFILPDVFKTEVCKGYDVQAVCAVLLEHGALIVKESGRYNIKTKLPGHGPARPYLISPAIFALDL